MRRTEMVVRMQTGEGLKAVLQVTLGARWPRNVQLIIRGYMGGVLGARSRARLGRDVTSPGITTDTPPRVSVGRPR